MAEPNKTMWRSQSAKLTIEAIQGLTNGHISNYVFDVYNGDTLANTSFTNAGEGVANGRSISTSEHLASGNHTGYTDYTVKGYLKYTHTAYGMETTATSNKVTKSLRVQEPLDTESLTGFTISPNVVWSNVAEAQNITITPSFVYTPFSKLADITCSQSANVIGGGSAGASKLELNGKSSVQYQNNNANKDLGATSKYIEFFAYSITGTSANVGAFLHSTSLTVKNAVTGLNIPASLTTYNNATSWSQSHQESVRYTPAKPYSKDVSLVDENKQAYPGNTNTITQNGVSVTLNPSTGVFTFDVSKAEDPKVDTTFKFRVKSIQGQNPVFSNVMTFTVQGFEPSHSVPVLEGETFVIENLGIGTFNIPTNLQHVTVTKTGNDLGIAITGKAVSADTREEFTITSTSGSKVTIECTVNNLDDINCAINVGDTITFTGPEIAEAVGSGQSTITSISAIETGPASGNGTAYVSKEGNLVYYAPDHAVENVPITVIANNGASVLINIKVDAISMTIG